MTALTNFTEDLLKPYEMPGGHPSVLIRRLHVNDAGGSVSAVRFPAGFIRPAAGWYPCDEEFLLLEGEIVVSDIAYGEGCYAFLPAGHLRRDTRSDAGALTVACFSGPPVWTEGAAPGPMHDPTSEIRVALDGGSPGRSPFGPGRLLRRGDESESWILPALRGGVAPVGASLVWLEARAFLDVAPGQEYPGLTGSVFVRWSKGPQRAT